MLRLAAQSATGTLHRALAPGNAFILQPDPDARAPAPEGKNVLPYALRGMAVKDNITTLSTPTTCASKTLETYRSPFEAGVLEQLRSCMGTVVGKTNLDEFGMGSHSTNSAFGPVTNTTPFERISVGGSSGGSAIAVATLQCDMALGTDTGGSVRLPAAYTGVTGFKPSYGRISRWGVVPYANSMDTVGILAPSATSVMSVFRCAIEPDPRDPTSLTGETRSRIRQSITKSRKRERARRKRLGQWESEDDDTKFMNVRIGIPVEYNIEELDHGVRSIWKDALEIFQVNGATLVPISLPNTKHALSAYYVLAPAEAASNLSKYDGVRYGSRAEGWREGTGHVLYSNTRGYGFGEEVKRRILLGSYTLSSEARDNYFLKAQKVRRLVQRDFDRVFAVPNPLLPTQHFDLSDLDESTPMMDKLGPPQVDFIVCPTAPTAAPSLQYVATQNSVDTYMNDVFTVPASLAGLPAISVPFSISRQHKRRDHPNYTGIQIIGQFGDDQRVITIAEKLEAFRDARNLFRTPALQQFAVKNGVLDELRKLYLGEKENLAPGIGPRIEKILLDRKYHPVSDQNRQPWSEYASELTPEIRHVQTYGPRESRKPRTDKEISRDLKAALEIWEQIKTSENNDP
ncbi:amidase-domain-containing protein [Mollisia scopiformis]|uniref:Glutamyl-tRNA(Gln) amidotransferase subunit A, mitochondrial n=1 Tax=Mollisia scopiformis TaxID=149040 RepID=A0A132BA03_MOLSC|nr:amidase-domain-containing protein [Mollisia scopiformis]KUJ09236.1 amidase-domain-containing protein [Mollisia scopiformis]